eukprot:CAMPEP_0118798396 /NCGR_PEP_ID=MMETSP1161-20130426/804_1 /TAXON_ID=249345 /ORGANISM="Picochlorum oklahomensis, Strain CCMP2329" /LENGTH=376 /DNA_ID=CAMNT_0006725807 /DNA_START=217 /DNA_END=1344 /DNA_ORIENTATION=-
MSSSKKAERQLKELRRLMPWNWDARVEEHPPGEKAMHDFEDIVNYRVGGRKRRGGALAAVAQKTVVPRKKKTSKKLTQSYDESNKENIPPEELPAHVTKENVPVADEEAVKESLPIADEEAVKESLPVAVEEPVKEKKEEHVKEEEEEEVKKECDVAKLSPRVENLAKESSPMYGEKTPALVKEKSVVHRETPAAISPGLMLTPASTASKGLSSEQRQPRLKKEQSLSGRVDRAKSIGKAVRSNTVMAKKTGKKSTFATPEAALSLSPDTVDATQHSTARIVRFSDNVSIDLSKYGSALKMKRPSSCPPLFRTLPDHGRRVASPGKNPARVFATLQEHKSASRRATPYMKRDTAVFSREVTLSRLIREGVGLKDSA